MSVWLPKDLYEAVKKTQEHFKRWDIKLSFSGAVQELIKLGLLERGIRWG